jgi:hypothetical protein
VLCYYITDTRAIVHRLREVGDKVAKNQVKLSQHILEEFILVSIIMIFLVIFSTFDANLKNIKLKKLPMMYKILFSGRLEQPGEYSSYDAL